MVTATNELGTLTATTQVTITASIEGLSAVNDSPTELGQPTTLTATVSSGTGVSYAWAFGDGETGSGAVVTHTYPTAGRYTTVVTATDGLSLLTATSRVTITAALTDSTRSIAYTYDPLGRLVTADDTTGESFAYAYDAVGNRTALTSTTALSGTIVTLYTYDSARRLTDRTMSDGRVYTYTWSTRGQMLAEYTQGIPVRTFAYDGAGRLIEATLFTQTTTFVYKGLGDRVAVTVEGYGTTTYTLDYAAAGQILAETTITDSVLYLYGDGCLGEVRDEEWLYYLPDGDAYVRQGADAQGEVVSSWRFDPDGTLLEGPEGPVSHLVCSGVYDWSTGLLYKDGRYFDPTLGIWLALMPLLVIQGWGKKAKRRHGWYVWSALILFAGISGTLVACGQGTTMPSTPDPTLIPVLTPAFACTTTTSLPGSPVQTPTPGTLPVQPPVSTVYDRNAAVEYALTYNLNPNPEYQSLDAVGGDCTNFVSQALYAGGFKKNEVWEGYRQKLLASAPTYEKGAADPWTVAGYLRQFLLNEVSGTEEVVSPTSLAHVNGSSSVEAAKSNQAIFEGKNIQPGDVAFYIQDETLANRYPGNPGSPYVWTHAAIVTQVGPQTYFPDLETEAKISKPWVVDHSIDWVKEGYQPRSIDNTKGVVYYISVIHIPDQLPW